MNRKKITAGTIFVHTFFIVLALLYILPLCIVVSTSFATQEGIANYGYTFFPKSFTLDAYKYIFENSEQLVKSYIFTIVICLFIPLQLYMQGMAAYACMRAKWGIKLIRVLYFLGFISGGLIPTYIMYTQYLHIDNTIWVFFFPTLYSIWNIILFRTFFRNNPPGLIEAAKIDGAGELRIYTNIVIPISFPIFATQLIFTFIGTWNSWNTSMIYAPRNENMWTLGYLLQTILKKAQLVKTMEEQNVTLDVGNLMVEETVKYATLVVAAAPGMIIMPFLQKYFQKGVVVGSMKE